MKNLRLLFVFTLKACLILVYSNLLPAQTYLHQAIIANGGIFEFSAPFQDRATIGYYNPQLNTYTVFDTIQVESVQDIVIDGNYAYLAAQDTIIKYNINTYQREAVAYFPGLKKLEVSGNNLFVGKWYGSGPYFAVYNKNNLQQLYTISQVNQTVDGMVQYNDTIYVAYNIKGTIDLFPPFGIYADSIGKLAVIHAPTQTFVRDEILGEDAAGIGKLFIYNNFIYGICVGTGKIVRYNPTTTVDTFLNAGIMDYIRHHNGVVYGNFALGIQAYDLNTQTYLSTPNFVPTVNLNTAEYDYVNNRFYFTETDYATYGMLYRYNAINGQKIDSVNIGISPDAIALDFRVNNVSVNEVEKNYQFKVYPNPFNDFINIETEGLGILYVYDINGRLYLEQNLNTNRVQINTESLPQGVYVLKLRVDNDVQTIKLIK